MTEQAPRQRKTLHCGTVTLFGWTNVGKSTLLNRLIGAKLAAVADVAQTTRNRITGVLSLKHKGQIVFVDTPGLHKPHYSMNRAMVHLARQALERGLRDLAENPPEHPGRALAVVGRTAPEVILACQNGPGR